MWLGFVTAPDWIRAAWRWCSFLFALPSEFVIPFFWGGKIKWDPIFCLGKNEDQKLMVKCSVDFLFGKFGWISLVVHCFGLLI